MSDEQRGAYVVDISFDCPVCKAQIGNIVDLCGRAKLVIGCVSMTQLHGHCLRCGGELHFEPPSQHWLQIQRNRQHLKELEAACKP